jgi:hypothetical protein
VAKERGHFRVANEVGIDEWQETFDMLNDQLSPERRITINEKVTDYIAMYGMQTQNLNCKKGARIGSRQVRPNCMKMEGTTPLHGLENASP